MAKADQAYLARRVVPAITVHALASDQLFHWSDYLFHTGNTTREGFAAE